MSSPAPTLTKTEDIYTTRVYTNGFKLLRLVLFVTSVWLYYSLKMLLSSFVCLFSVLGVFSLLILVDLISILIFLILFFEYIKH